MSDHSIIGRTVYIGESPNTTRSFVVRACALRYDPVDGSRFVLLLETESGDIESHLADRCRFRKDP